MQTTLIIFGNITFEGGKCIIHETQSTMMVNKDDADNIGDALVNFYDGFVVPALFKGQIIWE